MASYRYFWRQRRQTIQFPRKMIPLAWEQRLLPEDSISFQDMLGLLVRPDVGVIVIQGIQGSGKTWAANAAYRAARTSNLFQEYVWVPLSMNSTMGQCINKIAASLSCNKGDFRPKCNKEDNLSIERAKAIIMESLTKRKFLLVLDNVYFTEESILECLGVPRPQQQSLGSKIFVTTRTTRGESVMEPDIVIMPQPLTYEKSYDLLREKIGKDISCAHELISSCFGMPLTIILLAGVLCDAPTQEAFSELAAKAHTALGAQISVYDTLERMVKFGYHQLPSDTVRHCLLYCLLFQEDHEISVKELIWHWKTDGLLVGFDELNHIGMEILDVLVKHSMVYLDDNGHIHMHDVIRETLSRYGNDNGYKEQRDWHASNPIIRLEHPAKYSRRVPLMGTEMECLDGSLRPYGVSKNGAVQNLRLCDVEDLADLMDMLWLPSGLTFNLSDKHGLEVSLAANMGGNTHVYASDAYFFNCLKKDSPLWLNCFWKFQIVISCSMDNQTMDTDAQAMKTDSTFQDSYFRTKRFSHSIEPYRYLEINGTIGVPSDLDGILGHAELISLKRLAMTTQFSDLNISSMEAVRELWVENCERLESFLTAEVVQALSTMGNLHSLWISNMENLSSFCKGVEDVTSFSCLKHLLFDCCPNLKCLFPSVLHFPNLETLNIRFCDILERVFDSNALGEDTLPRLQSLQLWELPELTSFCSGVLPSLKNLKVRGCAKLRKIPVGVNENSPFVTTIGEQLWWDSLIWDDETIKRWLLFRNWRPLLPHIATEG